VERRSSKSPAMPRRGAARAAPALRLLLAAALACAAPAGARAGPCERRVCGGDRAGRRPCLPRAPSHPAHPGARAGGGPGPRSAPLLRGRHFYDGAACAPEHECPAPGCLFPGLQTYGGAAPSNCSWWAAGRFDWDRAGGGEDDAPPWAPPPLPPSLPRCAAVDAPGAFAGDTWAGPPARPGGPPACGYRWFGPRAAASCLAGRRILFAGDSLVRQLRRAGFGAWGCPSF
jgi:hypothetical protein